MEIKRYLNIIFKEISFEWFLKKVHNIYVSFSYLIAIFIIGILIYKTMYINLYKESMNSEWKELIKCDFKQKLVLLLKYTRYWISEEVTYFLLFYLEDSKIKIHDCWFTKSLHCWRLFGYIDVLQNFS